MTTPLDEAFIESQHLIDRYLDGKLPYKGARDLEAWCRAHPDYLRKARLGERTVAALKLLEANGTPQDLSEPRLPWWKRPQTLGLTALVAAGALIGCIVLAGKLSLVQGRLQDAEVKLDRGTLSPPGSARPVRIAPDRTAEAGTAKLALDHHAAQLVELAIDLSYVSDKHFRFTVDKRDQARVLVLGDLGKDSNGEAHITFNTSALGAGGYDVRIQALPMLGAPTDVGWFTLEVR